MDESPARAPDPWYEAGLCFECLPDCGACCSNHDQYSHVYLEGDDASRMARHLGLSHEEFARRYTEIDDGQRVLRMDQPACPFLDGTRCGVYAVRPVQCRTFPFWPETLRSRAAWRALRRFCPGIDTGPRHTLLAIQDRLTERAPDV